MRHDVVRDIKARDGNDQSSAKSLSEALRETACLQLGEKLHSGS